MAFCRNSKYRFPPVPWNAGKRTNRLWLGCGADYNSHISRGPTGTSPVAGRIDGRAAIPTFRLHIQVSHYLARVRFSPVR